MIRISHDQRCECSAPVKTGRFYYRRESCRACNLFIVVSQAEAARLASAALEAERLDLTWPNGAPPISKERTREVIREQLELDRDRSQSWLMMHVSRHHGSFQWSPSVFQRLLQSVREELGIPSPRGGRPKLNGRPEAA